jgi:hypothetical protein
VLLGWMRDINMTQHALVTRPDVQAMAWIRENTPKDGRFLVKLFSVYGGSVVAGSNGGLWLPLQTRCRR